MGKKAKKKQGLSEKQRNYQKKAKKLVKLYTKKFGLGGYQYSFKFLNNEEARDNYGREANSTYAEVFIDGDEVELYINQALMEEAPAAIENTVVHELLHVLLFGLVDKAERITKAHVRKVTHRNRINRKIERLEHEVIEVLTPLLIGR